MSKTYILDSFALLSWLGDEKGSDQVKQVLSAARDGGAVSIVPVVSLGEMYYVSVRKRGQLNAERALRIVQQLPIRFTSVSHELALAAARIRALHTISYVDAIAASVALGTGGILVTGDPEFRALEDRVQILWL